MNLIQSGGDAVFHREKGKKKRRASCYESLRYARGATPSGKIREGFRRGSRGEPAGLLGLGEERLVGRTGLPSEKCGKIRSGKEASPLRPKGSAPWSLDCAVRAS